jgi:hypothetical protein
MTAEQSSALSFVHDRSELLTSDPVLAGTTRWIAPKEGMQIFLAWRWALITLDVICIVSPLEVESNLFVIGEDPFAKRRRLNLMISELNWQPTVIEFINSTSIQPGPPKTG